MASRSLDDLHADFSGLAKAWLAECRAQGLDPLVYCTFRSLKEQAELFAQGRGKSGKLVTMARPGESAHNYGLALDFVPLVNGKPDWSGTHPAWADCIAIAEGLGIESASKWLRFKEWPHLQLPGWRNHLQAAA